MKRQQLAYCILLTLFLFVANNESVFGQGKLGRVRDAVRHSKPAKPKTQDSHDDDRRPKSNNRDRGTSRRDHRPSKRKRRRSQQRCDSGLDLFFGPALAAPVREVHVVHHTPQPVVAVPVYVEPAPVPQPVYQPVVAPVAPVSPVSPVASQPVSESDYFVTGVESFDWGVRMSAIGGADFDDIAFGRLDLLLQSPNGIGLDTSVSMIRESGMSFRDHLYLGDVNLVYEPIFQDNFRLRIGLGLNWLGDSYGGDAGFNMTSGFDWRLTERTLVTGEIDLGTIGDTDIVHSQISVGRSINQTTEWTVGYDYLDIGGVTIGSAFTGLRFRF